MPTLSGKENYQEERAEKLERSRQLATKLAAESERMSEKGWEALSQIPFGQPILVGHHSERSDRAYRSRAVGMIDRAVEVGRLAEEQTRKAEAIESNNAISSDDPEAVEKLTAKIARMEESHAKAKEAAKAMRARGEYVPAYILTNSNANIRRVKERLAQLVALRSQGTNEDIKGEGFSFTEDASDNRVLLTFKERQTDAVTALVKSHGFKWSPRRSCWCRQITPNARYAAKRLAEKLNNPSL